MTTADERRELARWLTSLQALVPVPASHARPAVPADDARAMLRCSAVTWDALVAEGLPAHSTDAGERYDEHDLFNLALHSGSGTSLPELAVRFAFGFLRQPPSSWCAPRVWRMRVEVTCPATPCGADGEWALWSPLDPDAAATPPRVPERHAGTGGRLTVDRMVSTVGGLETLRSPRLAALIDGVLALDLRYARMPAALQADPDWMIDRGLVDCVTGSCHLERLATAAGFAARTRSGWLAAPAVSEHAWAEVLDDDGRWKCLDLAYRALSATFSLAGCDAFRQFCIGSRLNRLVPTACPAGDPLATHRCGGADREVRCEVVLSPTDAAPVRRPAALRHS